MDPSKDEYSPQVINPGGGSNPPVEPAQSPPRPPGTESDQTNTQSFQPPEPQPHSSDAVVSPGPPNPKKSGSKLKKFGIALVVFLVLTGGSAYGYFRWYNSPGTVWSQGLDRSAVALNEYIDTSLELAKEQEATDYQIDGSADLDNNGTKFSGTFTSQFSPLATDNSLDVEFSSSDSRVHNVSLDVMSSLAEEAGYPDVFFRVNGLSGLGLEGFLPNINKFDNRWIEITSKQLENAFKETVETEEFDPRANRVTPEETRSLIKTLSSKINEYMLTSDEEKTVLILEEFIEKETTDQGVEAYRYNVKINPGNAKKFCEDLTKSVLAEPAFKKLSGISDEKINEYSSNARKDCNKGVEEIVEETGEINLWMNTEDRVVHKVRVHDKVKANGYVEFGQVYKNEDALRVFVIARKRGEVSSDVKFDMDSNIRKNTASGETTFSYSSKNSRNSGRVNFNVKPLDNPVEVEKPKDTLNINKVLEELGLGEYISF